MGKKLIWGVLAAAVASLLILGIFPVRGVREARPPRVLATVGGEGTLSAGGASLPLGAPAGAPVGGFPRFRWTSEGVRDEPMVRALVLSEPGVSLALASVDVLLVPAALQRKVEERVAGLGLDAVIVSATHTHAGPGGHWRDLLGERFGTGPFDPAWEEALAGRIADAIRAAAADRGPARLSVAGSRREDLVVNRNGGDAGGRLLVARLTRPGGEPVGQVVVFPSHATIVHGERRLLSGDWPAALARDLPGTTVVLQGTLGDQTWKLPPSSERSPEAYAALVAAEVRGLPFPAGSEAPALAAASAEVTLPAPSFGAVPRFLDRLVSNLLWSWLPERTRVFAVRLGPALLAAVPAEPGEAVGGAWRGELGEDVTVVSLTGDYVGYVDTAAQVRAHAGEAKRTYLGPGLSRTLLEGLAAAKGALPPAAGN